MTDGRVERAAPPPSDARERLELALNRLAFPCDTGTPQEAADAILAAINEELEPIAENLKATAINVKDARERVDRMETIVAEYSINDTPAKVAALTARVEETRAALRWH